jgi:hypothetical protein
MLRYREMGCHQCALAEKPAQRLPASSLAWRRPANVQQDRRARPHAPGPEASSSAPSSPRFEFDFSRIPVHAQGQGAVVVNSLHPRTDGDARPFFHLRTAEQEGTDAGAGRPIAPRGYGFTQCNFPGGAKSTILTSGCNKPCTELHENVHLKDIKGCCEQATSEYFLARSAEEKDRVRATWARWTESILATTECRAYAVSLPCLDRLIGEKKCQSEAMKPEDKECCGELKLARDDDDAGSKQYCPSALPVLPRCPFGPSGPSGPQGPAGGSPVPNVDEGSISAD